MSSAYERLKSLFSIAGLSVESGSYAEAEAYALSVGIDLVKNALDEIKSRIFFTLADGEPNLKAYAKMLGINAEKIESAALCKLIRKRLSADYGEAQLLSKLLPEQELLGSFTLQRTQNGVLVSGVDGESLYHIGHFLQGAAVCGTNAYLEFSGLTFDERDALLKTFRFWDGLNLPFSCIDTLDIALF